MSLGGTVFPASFHPDLIFPLRWGSSPQYLPSRITFLPSGGVRLPAFAHPSLLIPSQVGLIPATSSIPDYFSALRWDASPETCCKIPTKTKKSRRKVFPARFSSEPANYYAINIFTPQALSAKTSRCTA